MTKLYFSRNRGRTVGEILQLIPVVAGTQSPALLDEAVFPVAFSCTLPFHVPWACVIGGFRQNPILSYAVPKCSSCSSHCCRDRECLDLER